MDKEACKECENDRYTKKKGKAHVPPLKILRHINIIERIQTLFH